MLPVVLVVAVPIVPFLFFGAALEERLQAWRSDPPSQFVVGLAAVGLLASDIFLPVPSSLICTLAGWQLGTLWGTLTCWTGMNLGAIAGFALAKRWGRPFAAWFSSPEQLEKTARIAARFGPVLLALVRGVPVLAEASVLWMGLHGLSWRAYLPPVLLSNLALALAFCLLGDVAETHEWLAVALAASVAIPIALAALAQRWLVRGGETTE
jgi:uncharacterized membrane protein YdjX (TVP38/TMEM64 family)